MTATSESISTTFPISDLGGFKQRVLSWASRHHVSCFLDHNNYRSYPYHEVEALVGVGVEEEIVQFSEGGAFDRLKKFHREKQGWLFGLLAYDLKNDVEQLSSENFDGIGFPALHFFRPIVVFEIHTREVTIHSVGETPLDIFRAVCEIPLQSAEYQIFAKQKLNARIKKEDYLDTVQTIRRHIRQGDVYEMNFCQEFFAEDSSIDPVQTFRRLNHISKAPFSAFYKLRGRHLLCASPERFLKKTGSQLITQPIKGTTRRGETPGEDAMLREKLFRSAKDRSENVMIVDLVRNDLSRSCVAGSVKVEELFGAYSFEQVHQLISTVTGTLRPGVHFIDAIRHSFPMGSMTGAPKVRSMQLIEAYEKTKRGLYSGAVGYITPSGDFDFNVVIRSILFNELEKYLSVQVGGAIVYDSVPEMEYEECLLKAKGMFSVLGAG